MISKLSNSIVRLFNAVVITCILVALGGFAAVIGVYSQTQTIGALEAKASNSADLASIALSDPLWNFDTAGMDSIFKAILLDSDVGAIRVVKTPSADATKKSTPIIRFSDPKKTSGFEELQADSSILVSSAKIMKDGAAIATVEILTSNAKAKASARQTTLLVAGFALGLAFIMAWIIYVLGAKIIKRPIDLLRSGADRLAQGDLDIEIDSSHDNEIGALARSFDHMRSAIKKKLFDMDVLNRTGERMAGIHDQNEAIELALKVMSDQTKVERASIYLFDEASKLLSLHACHPALADGAKFPRAFRLDEGVAGQVAASGKTLFVQDTSQSADYVSAAGEAPKSLLCVPMMDDRKVFGIMNFVGSADKVVFTQEDEAFALTIARMAVVTIKNIKMLEVIEEQNRTLEERILERTAELRTKTNDVNNMLQNMRQGIFTITAGGSIHPEHSAYLLEIFEPKTPPAGQKAVEFLFNGSDVGSDAANQVLATIEAVIGEDPMNFEFNAHLFVTEYSIACADGRHKTIELDWNPVVGVDTVDKIMVTARDVTELKALQRETERQKTDLEIIGQILATSKTKLLDFLATTEDFIKENEKLISGADAADQAVLGELFRNMHTIKGNARTYGLTYMGDSVHAAETAYSRLRASSGTGWPKDELLSDLVLVRLDLDKYQNTYKEKLAGFTATGAEDFDQTALADIAKAVSAIRDSTPTHELLASLLHVRRSVDSLTSEALGQVVSGVVSAVPSIARQLGKIPPAVYIRDGQVRIKKEIVPVLRNVFMHLFRNSLDHGLEATSERLIAGKLGTGEIRLTLDADEDGMVFCLADDGRGLDLGAIEEKSRSLGKFTSEDSPSDEQLAESVFIAGLSTADIVTEVSGRGVGMDAVRNFLRKHRGDVSVVFDGPRIGDFRPFHIRVELPSSFAVKP